MSDKAPKNPDPTIFRDAQILAEEVMNSDHYHSVEVANAARRRTAQSGWWNDYRPFDPEDRTFQLGVARAVFKGAPYKKSMVDEVANVLKHMGATFEDLDIAVPEDSQRRYVARQILHRIFGEP